MEGVPCSVRPGVARRGENHRRTGTVAAALPYSQKPPPFFRGHPRQPVSVSRFPQRAFHLLESRIESAGLVRKRKKTPLPTCFYPSKRFSPEIYKFLFGTTSLANLVPPRRCLLKDNSCLFFVTSAQTCVCCLTTHVNSDNYALVRHTTVVCA